MRDWLHSARKEKGFTQAKMAEILRISPAYYLYIENGDRQKKMDLALAVKLAAIFGIPLAQIVEWETDGAVGLEEKEILELEENGAKEE